MKDFEEPDSTDVIHTNRYIAEGTKNDITMVNQCFTQGFCCYFLTVGLFQKQRLDCGLLVCRCGWFGFHSLLVDIREGFPNCL